MAEDDLGISSGAATPTEAAEDQHPHHHHHHPHLPAGRKLKHFFRPDGRKVQVAHSPEEFEHHRRRKSSVDPEKDLDGEYDVVMHGSAEHVEALREAHSHHCDRREELRERHGEAYREFERIHATLDALNQEIHDLSERAVQLDASFSKYGYSAHLRMSKHTTRHV